MTDLVYQDYQYQYYINRGIAPDTLPDMERNWHIKDLGGWSSLNSLSINDLELMWLQIKAGNKLNTSTATKTASSTYLTNVAANAFDSNLATFWWSQTFAPQWLQVQFVAPQIVKGWRLYFNDAFVITGTLLASNDGIHWTTLDTFTNISQFIWQGNTFSNITAYTYYRLNITNSGIFWIKVYEFELYNEPINIDIDDLWFGFLDPIYGPGLTVQDLKYALYKAG